MTETVSVDPAACPADPDDLISLECAETAAADYLVTRNRKHYPGEWKKTASSPRGNSWRSSQTPKAAIRLRIEA